MSSVALQVLQKLDRGYITVDEAEQMILKGWTAINRGPKACHRKPRVATEIPNPSAMSLPTMFRGESSALWM